MPYSFAWGNSNPSRYVGKAREVLDKASKPHSSKQALNLASQAGDAFIGRNIRTNIKNQLKYGTQDRRFCQIKGMGFKKIPTVMDSDFNIS